MTTNVVTVSVRHENYRRYRRLRTDESKAVWRHQFGVQRQLLSVEIHIILARGKLTPADEIPDCCGKR